jgi:hypothetical protein
MDENKKTGPRDVFTHLLAIIFLYVGVFAFGAVVFSLINIKFPDYLGEYGIYARDSLRMPLAILIIIFPFYLWLMHYLEKDMASNPEKRELKTRKWLLYFTLFATTIAIVIDLISLIFKFLSGELTLPFGLKIATVLVIAGAIFSYYLWVLRKKITLREDKSMKLFVRAVIAVVILAIVTGFYMAGSPQSERARRFDDQRVNDLTNIQSQVTNYWRAKQKLPQSLDDLRDPISSFIMPQDPETNANYEYRVMGDKTFELCATFRTTSVNNQTDTATPMRIGVSDNWAHGEGKVCFSRTIDPELYPPLKKQ